MMTSGLDAFVSFYYVYYFQKIQSILVACSCAIRHNEADFENYRRLQTTDTQETYISSRNYAKCIFHNTKISLLCRKLNNYYGSSSFRFFWYFSKILFTLTSLILSPLVYTNSSVFCFTFR